MVINFAFQHFVEVVFSGQRPQSFLNGHFVPQGVSSAQNEFYKDSLNFEG